MTDSNATELLRAMLDGRGVKWYETINHVNCVFTWWDSPTFGTVHAMDNEDGETLFMACLNNCDFTPEQAIAATLGWIDEPDTIRNELADGGLIADVLAPVCVDEKERRAFERGRVHERFAQQIFKEATS